MTNNLLDEKPLTLEVKVVGKTRVQTARMLESIYDRMKCGFPFLSSDVRLNKDGQSYTGKMKFEI